MSTFSAALHALNINHAEAAELLGRIKATAIADMVRGKTRVPEGIWRDLSDLFELVEREADDIIADQGELDGGECVTPLDLDVSAIPLPHPKLRAAAAARAIFVLGPRLLHITDE